jgi:uncharacterized protein
LADLLIKLHLLVQKSLTFRILADAFSLFGQLWVFVLAGILITASLKTSLPREAFARFFRKKRSGTILAAACIGAVSPFGAYTAVPLAAGLYAMGMPLAPLTAFLIASPLIDVNLFFLTAGSLGIEMAVCRAVSALVLGIAGGFAVQLLFSGKAEAPRNHPLPGGGPVRTADAGKSVFERWSREFLGQTRFIGKYFLLALAVAALVKNCVPSEWIMRSVGKSPFVSVLFAAGAGIPLYACGGAAIPVMRELADMGMSKGAVLAFLISGPATKVSTLVLVKSAFGTKLFLVFLAVTLTGAVILGWAYNLWG